MVESFAGTKEGGRWKDTLPGYIITVDESCDMTFTTIILKALFYWLRWQFIGKSIFEMASSNLISETNLSSDFWLNNSGSNSQSNGRIKSSCIASCQKQFTDDNGDKIKGRGAYKAECWAQTAIKVAAVMVAIVAL